MPPVSTLTVLEVLRRSTEWLRGRGIEQPRLDAELLMAHALGVQRLDLYVQFDRPLTEEELGSARGLVRARGDHTPVAYIVGQREFYSLEFAVDARVLVPRPETEHLVEAALAHLAPREAPVFADIGTGSGCIAISVLKGHAGARAHAVDVSPDALEVARENVARHEVGERIALHGGDLLAPLRASSDWGRLDAVLSNPPYVLADDPALAPDVRAHEPAAALFVPGSDALAYVRRIAVDALEALAPGGLLACEIGHESGADALALFDELGYLETRLIPDLARIDRVVLGQRRT